jgi:hypothetical protein
MTKGVKTAHHYLGVNSHAKHALNFLMCFFGDWCKSGIGITKIMVSIRHVGAMHLCSICKGRQSKVAFAVTFLQHQEK